MFDRIAPRYDLLNHLLSAGADRRWRRRALEALEPQPSVRVLDLCCGTADLLIEALRCDRRRCGVGVDLSLEMLERGAEKLAARGLAARARLVGGAAEQLPFRGGVFDAALVAFGIRNVGEVPAALGELRRVLRPGGRLVVLELSEPRGLLAAAFRLYFQEVLPRLAGLISDRAAYEYLPASVRRFPSAESFAEILHRAGFEDVCWRRLSGGMACLHQGSKAP
jgi:demethylmenaquinone methyltransferase/2-methoxy-6-polyprenyl-1,4-benzoquinol methylase